ncbi:hypothetical protein KC19_N015900 [Ceratodon purpureus]|nr:hypothetical protein KC19_N015900 [Ceratodon purpureus]
MCFSTTDLSSGTSCFFFYCFLSCTFLLVSTAETQATKRITCLRKLRLGRTLEG